MYKHGGTGTRLYKIWERMKARCQSPANDEFHRYGAAGITVCAEWQQFEPFRDWALANGYAASLTLDRRKNDQGYAPGNCRWATISQQNRNHRRRSDSASPYKGMYRDRTGRWVARITSDGVVRSLGTFADPEAAARAYDAAAKVLHGEFACLNFP